METFTDENERDAEVAGYSVTYISAVSVTLILIIFSTIVGNFLVIITILATRDLRTNVSYWLLLSLAFSDVLVSVLVMPLSLKRELQTRWTSGPVLCDIWISLDVTCCTVSILNIAAIAVDRFCSITQKTTYVANRRLINLTLVPAIWLLSFVISLPPLFGWREEQNHGDPEQCLISQDLGYTVFSTFGAFYLPLAVMLVCYCKIYRIARASFRRRATRVLPYVPRAQAYRNTDKTFRGTRTTPGTARGIELDAIALHNVTKTFADSRPASVRSGLVHSSNERRAVVTLGVLMGVFIICWFPFFIQATVLPFCRICAEKLPSQLSSFVLWLGYCNSLLNPLIYTFCNKDYRAAFKKLFCNTTPITAIL
ncbi:5-hydroxytryptamine receptor 1A-like [Ptychodera flava]|uniref:5-hydroxytryptamine receptor 1A-like n=1 Tax=Ptychodera flava TaxID=63121 RepID=UPI003969E128